MKIDKANKQKKKKKLIVIDLPMTDTFCQTRN